MSAIDVLKDAIYSLFLFSRKLPDVPGAAIARMSQEKREELQKLTSSDTQKMIIDPLELYDQKATDDLRFKQDKLRFDQVILKK